MTTTDTDPKKERSDIVSFVPERLDSLLGAPNSDRRRARIRLVNAEFARRGMSVSLARISSGVNGPSAGTLYILSKALEMPMEHFIDDRIVEVEREARMNPAPPVDVTPPTTQSGAVCSAAEDATCVLDVSELDGQARCLTCGLLGPPENEPTPAEGTDA